MHSRPPSELPCPLPTAGQAQPVWVPSPGPGPTPQLGGLARGGGCRRTSSSQELRSLLRPQPLPVP